MIRKITVEVLPDGFTLTEECCETPTPSSGIFRMDQKSTLMQLLDFLIVEENTPVEVKPTSVRHLE